MKKNYINLTIFLLLILGGCSSPVADGTITPTEDSYDVVIYGGTASGVIAACQLADMGKYVALIASSPKHLGGMCTSGLSNVDIGKYESIGGMAKSFFETIQNNKLYPTFEPSRALSYFTTMLASRKKFIKVIYDDGEVNQNSIVKNEANIEGIFLKDGRYLRGKVFIDTSYEGDLMAFSGVSYTVGRESNSTYGETLNGIREPDFSWKISALFEDSNSTLLPFVNKTIDGNIGMGDSKIQPYNFRLCMTKDPQNRVMIEKPIDYNRNSYLSLIRYANLNPQNNFLSVVPIPNNKFDVNNEGYISTDLPGVNYLYPDGNKETRNQIKKNVETYMKGFIWTLQNDLSIPEVVRGRYKDLGLAKDEFVDNQNWPYLLYIREGRRMVGEYVMTEKSVRNLLDIDDSVGQGSYQIDCHTVQLVASSKGRFGSEGALYFPIDKPYKISYRSLLPKRSECSNLLVPVCLSASHVAYGTLRMEPVYMVLGQSAAIAAGISLEKKVSLHEINYQLLTNYLKLYGQVF